MNLGITGLGMITSVGRDAPSSCASIRAGITRPQPIVDFELLDPDTLQPVPLIGHPIRGFTEGFNMVGLWLRLAKKCLAELAADGRFPEPADNSFWNTTALVAVVPYIDDDRFYATGKEKPELIVQSFLVPLIRQLAWSIPQASLSAICQGQAGTPAAVALAEKLTTVGNFQRVIVLAVDSYLDSFSLEWLARFSRLKTPTNATGLMPGEAAVCFLLETLDSAQKRQVPVQALLEATGVAKESNDFYGNGNNRGVGLSQAIRHSLNGKGASLFFGDIISDHNGESWRAAELAGARLLLHDKVDPQSPFIFPATRIGDVGAANGTVAVGVAVRSFARQYSTSDRTLIWCSSDHGDVGAVLLRKSAK